MRIKHQTTHFIFNNFFLKIVPFMRYADNIVQPGRTEMTKWRMHFAGWIPKATNTHSEYVILTAFPLQQWLKGRASMLRYTYIGSIGRINYDESKKRWK
jgi:hypothetical protein